jgi:hypothetical protein
MRSSDNPIFFLEVDKFNKSYKAINHLPPSLQSLGVIHFQENH